MTKLPAMVLSIALCGLSFAHAQQAGERTTLSGVFTAEQAKNGERIFRSRYAGSAAAAAMPASGCISSEETTPAS